MKSLILLLTTLITLPIFVNSQTVTIGAQVWMTKNLDVLAFRNGDKIKQAKTNAEWEKAAINKQPAWCYYSNDTVNGRKYGKLYNCYAVADPRGLAPAGFHIPSDSELSILFKYLGGRYYAEKKLTGVMIDAENGNNSSGFSALPGGYRGNLGGFDYIDRHGYWWTSTNNNGNGTWNWYLDFRNAAFKNSYSVEGYGMSVRCIKD
jgi:uncharacterized protein (TIGR02145 family)